MIWALRNIRPVRTGVIVLGGLLVLLNLALGPDPVPKRIGSLLLLGAFAFIARGAVRWIFRYQIEQHDLQPWIVQLGTAVFYFFGVAALVGALREIMNIGTETPFAAAFVGPADWGAGFRRMRLE